MGSVGYIPISSQTLVILLQVSKYSKEILCVHEMMHINMCFSRENLSFFEKGRFATSEFDVIHPASA
jgi:hypothetical protein